MYFIICKSIKQKWWDVFVKIYLIKWYTVVFVTDLKHRKTFSN
ncbi:uncharacterized protein METZ01_LOCUS67899 [marine metagenome]|uniref:Uncharacterized protein n=1 Tax=marine metagenome TaxID=408172 RepID=A0A381TFX7_9ZZZZ